MQCRSVLTRIDAHRTGELDETQSRELESHLSTCSSCNESVDDVTEFAEIVRSLSHDAPETCCAELKETLSDSFGTFEAAGRRVWVGFSSRGVKMIDIRSTSAEEFRRAYCHRFDRDLRQAEVPEKYRAPITAALNGDGAKLKEIDLDGMTDFEQRVLRKITEIPKGEVRSYNWVARAAGRPSAVRAVGNIMARNPLPFVLPCHRVVPASGEVGNYGFGTAMKRELLRAEGAPVDEMEQLARSGVRFIGSRTTKIFCCPTCRDARRIREENRVAFHTVAEAEQAGYRACRRCCDVAMGA